MNGRNVRWALVLLVTGAVLTAGACADAAGAGNRGKASGEATFAGGCFWCMEAAFEKLEGMISVESGYTGGERRNPTYHEVSSGRTGHAEAVRVRYDPAVVDYQTLLDVFWHQIDPTDAGGQFADRGTQYRTAIFYHDDEQRRLAEASKAELGRSGPFDKPIVTAIVPAGDFWVAEDYHQDYYKKNAQHYKAYRRGSGREGFLERTWGAEHDAPAKPSRSAKPTTYAKPDDATLRERLTPLQYHVTQEEGTERPFQNEFWDDKRAGLYVDVVSGEPLFSSTDKFRSGTGWPSFTTPLVPEHVVQVDEDASISEVRSKYGDSHLGHVFPDGPPPTGLRYCINSAALRFVPAEDLAQAGLAEFAPLFEESNAKK